jgi:hypothetical protein
MDINHVFMFTSHLWIQSIGIYVYIQQTIDLISDGYRVTSVENGTIGHLEKELGLTIL